MLNILLRIPLFRQNTAREVGMNVNKIKEFSTNWLKPFKQVPPSTNDSTTLLKFLDVRTFLATDSYFQH